MRGRGGVRAITSRSRSKESLPWLESPSSYSSNAKMKRMVGSSGDDAKAHALLEELEARSRSDYVPPYDLALLHTGLGNPEQALECLEKAYQERYGWLVYLNADAIWDRLRSEPGFRSLVNKIGLPAPS